MSPATPEQRNAYKGKSPRAWLRLRLRAESGAVRELECLADTGCPCMLILSAAELSQWSWGEQATVDSNFGPLQGGWLRLALPELGLDRFVIGYASDEAVALAKQNSPDFEGLAGLPLLRLGEYGGDADAFWLRRASKHA